MNDTWTINEAIDNFAEVANAAWNGKPQFVTQTEKPDLVILCADTYKNLMETETAKNRAFTKFLLSIPKGTPFTTEDDREELALRDIQF